MENNKEIFDYWHKRVKLKQHRLIGAAEHVTTYQLRHECTNYDDLRCCAEVMALPEAERAKIIAIIKYECTSRVLQARTGFLREKAEEYQNIFQELTAERSRLHRLFKILQEKLFGKDNEIKQLEAKVAALEAQNQALQAKLEASHAYTELLQEFEQLKKQFEQTQKAREKLAKNNQSLGGRVAHTLRFQQERDQARQQVKELLQENKALKVEIDKYRKILKIHPHV